MLRCSGQSTGGTHLDLLLAAARLQAHELVVAGRVARAAPAAVAAAEELCVLALVHAPPLLLVLRVHVHPLCVPCPRRVALCIPASHIPPQLSVGYVLSILYKDDQAMLLVFFFFFFFLILYEANP